MRSQPGEQVLIIDAGGGTIDISTYAVLNNRPLRVEELYESKCESDLSQQVGFPFDSFHSRLAPRWRVRHNNGKGGDPRCILTFHSKAEYSTLNQRSWRIPDSTLQRIWQ